MRRRDFLKAAVLGGGALAIPSVALAQTEPTAPILSVELVLGQYPRIRETRLRCDGTDVIEFRDLRIETLIRVESFPSAHWDQRLIVEYLDRFDPSGNPVFKEQWQELYRHANVPPDGTKVFESIQVNQDLVGHDTWRVFSRVNDLVWGTVFENECIFSVSPDAT